ncbi:pulmonary surfactant-associated protein C isoform X1 [Aquila chrysaetos chrysaetos]|uniref:Surfactant protein C n=1 Tax=Aquila chrysaetos chrysaetos TaxID=223781 RepID=A0A663E9H7_AQUCH|nr:pulmonary surfactant-associated protein C isoform X1 [Aquila chrysaetos chrysaetos]
MPGRGPRRFHTPSPALLRARQTEHKWHLGSWGGPSLLPSTRDPINPPSSGWQRDRSRTVKESEMDDSSKEALMEEAPPRYTASPRLPCIPHQLKCLLIVVVVVVILVVVIVTFLLLGLHITETHAETVLRMTIHGLDGEGNPQHLSMSKKERTGTFAVRDGLNASAAVVYDYSKLLVGYRSWRHRACYITRLDEDNIPGLDAVTETFQRRQAEMKEAGDNAVPLADRSVLGTTINILCSTVPVYWA